MTNELLTRRGFFMTKQVLCAGKASLSHNGKSIRISLSILANVMAAIILAACTVNGTLVKPFSAQPGINLDGRDTHERLHALLWTQTSAEYVWAAEFAYARAYALVDGALSDSRWTAAVEQQVDYSAKPPAVVMDLDETVLDNSAFQGQLILDRSDYDKPLWIRWVKQQRLAPTAVPGAIEFIKYALSKEVHVFFVTNRDCELEADTRATLKKLGVILDETMDTVLSTGENGWTSDKAERRRFLASGYRIILLVGDDLGDFVSARETTGIENLTPNQRVQLALKYRDFWEKKWILLPNPIYGGWETAISGKNKMTDTDILKVKRDSLRGMHE